jgi:two-component system, cell cycle response regulator DivK
MASVLIIEDNRANMKLTSVLLRNAGHAVLCAVDAETGLTLARAALPDLILMDIQLPGMDGLEAAALLKQDPATAAIPIIAVSATAINTESGLHRSRNYDAYIAKPLHYKDLLAAIGRLLGQSESFTAGAENFLQHAP